MRQLTDAVRLQQLMAGLGRSCRDPRSVCEPEMALYRLLAAQHGNGAYSQYNALIRSLVSFERALARRGPGGSKPPDER